MAQIMLIGSFHGHSKGLASQRQRIVRNVVPLEEEEGSRVTALTGRMICIGRNLVLLVLMGQLANGQQQQQPPSLPPPAEFVRDIMVFENCYGLVFHSDTIEVTNAFVGYRILSPFDSTPVSVLDVKYPEIIKPEKYLTTDLHVVPDISRYLRFLIGHFDKRPRTDTDPWLINIKDVSSARDMLNSVKMDIDDLVYLYIGDNAGDFFEIFEAYKISPDWPATILHYGTWSREFGLNVTDVEIWQRRRDFQVILPMENIWQYIHN